MKAKKKDKLKISTGSKEIDNLYKAVIAYIEANDGKVVVIGGVSVIEWPNDGKFKYMIGIKITGKKPKFKATT